MQQRENDLFALADKRDEAHALLLRRESYAK